MNHTNNNAFAVTEQLTKTQHATLPTVPVCSWSVVSVVLCSPMIPMMLTKVRDSQGCPASEVRDSQGCPASLLSISVDTHRDTRHDAEWQGHDNLWLRQIFDNTKPVSYNQPSPFHDWPMKRISSSLYDQLAFIALLSDGQSNSH
jgi:hypothetical protein